jgi:hypothetical protein
MNLNLIENEIEFHLKQIGNRTETDRIITRSW